MKEQSNASWFENHPILSIAIVLALAVVLGWLLFRKLAPRAALVAEAIAPRTLPPAPPIISPWSPLL
jgi:hypothetical protein